MADFVFINPSPNMEQVAKTVVNMGNSALRLFTPDYISQKVNTLWCYAGGDFSELSASRGIRDIDSNILSLKKPLLAKFKYRYIKQKIAEINPKISSCNFQDYILLAGQYWKEAEVPVEISELDFDRILAKYPSHTIIASKIPALNGKTNMTIWRTDYDFQEALGNDYYFFFDKNGRHEIFCDEDRLVTISEQKNLNWFKDINPTMKRFAFEQIRSVNYHVNTAPWIQKHSSRVYLVNDYSWQGISTVLPEAWARAVHKAISIKKK
jgi:hypothetical protein